MLYLINTIIQCQIEVETKPSQYDIALQSLNNSAIQ